MSMFVPDIIFAFLFVLSSFGENNKKSLSTFTNDSLISTYATMFDIKDTAAYSVGILPSYEYWGSPYDTSS